MAGAHLQTVVDNENPGENLRDAELPDGFDAFWLLYPRHIAKKTARVAWERIPEAKWVEIITATAAWRRVWLARGEIEYVPHPSTWLNGERWEDELPREYRAAAHVPVKPIEAHVRGEMPEHVRALIAKLKAGR